MKTTSGRVTSSNPICLSKATSVFTTFVAADTGASQADAAYLRRTVEAFNELTQLHRELKGSKSSRKHKRAKHWEVEEEGVKHSEEQESKKKRRRSD